MGYTFSTADLGTFLQFSVTGVPVQPVPILTAPAVVSELPSVDNVNLLVASTSSNIVVLNETSEETITSFSTQSDSDDSVSETAPEEIKEAKVSGKGDVLVCK